MYIRLGRDDFSFGFCGVMLDHSKLTAQTADLRRELTDDEKDTVLTRQVAKHFRFGWHTCDSCFLAQWHVPPTNSLPRAVPNPGQWEWEPIILPVTGKMFYEVDRDVLDPRGTAVHIYDIQRAALR
jgi:hypothetical protein